MMKTQNTNIPADSTCAHHTAPQSTFKETEQPMPQGRSLDMGTFKHQTKQKAH